MPKASWGFRTGPASSLLHSIAQSRSPGQLNFKEPGNRSGILMGEVSKSHCKGGAKNCDHIQSAIAFVVEAREESWGLKVGTGSRGEVVLRKSQPSIRNAGRKFLQCDISRKELFVLYITMIITMGRQKHFQIGKNIKRKPHQY